MSNCDSFIIDPKTGMKTICPGRIEVVYEHAYGKRWGHIVCTICGDRYRSWTVRDDDINKRSDKAISSTS